MGAALCWAAAEAGYEVTAISGPSEVELPRGIKLICVQTAREMADASIAAWKTEGVSTTESGNYSRIFIAAAAVLDWDISNPSSKKLKKESGSPQLDLVKNPDILATISKMKTSGQFVLGFAAETDQPIENAQEKLRTKGCNAIFANDVSGSEKGFESPLNSGWWITSAAAVTPIETMTKTQLARKLIAMIEQSLPTSPSY
jgi:phosphopantothenoylcysteine decarboxylase/phosphopantothenate--cysteine ligase